MAQRQAGLVAEMLGERRVETDLVVVETTGDQLKDELIHRLGMTGAFVRTLDERVLEGSVDGAVHSMKDMPTEMPEELLVAGVPGRADPGDVLVTPDGRGVDGLPLGARVGTSSLRRGAQLRRVRGDLRVEPVRGNVDTRLEKLLAPYLGAEYGIRAETDESTGTGGEGEEEGGDDPAGDADDGSVQSWVGGLSALETRALERAWEGRYDALVLARAGLERLELLDAPGVHAVPLPVEQFVPAPGQGALAVTAVEDTDAGEVIHDAVDDPRTRVETTVERVVLAEVGGGCIAPIGVNAVFRGEYVHTVAQVLDREGVDHVRIVRDLPVREYLEGALDLADDLRDRGADGLVEAAQEEAKSREVEGG